MSYFREVVGRNFSSHADRNARRPVQEHEGELGRELHRLLKVPVVIGRKVDGARIHFLEKERRNGREARFCVAHRRRRIAVAGAEVAFGHKERIAERKSLRHAHEGVVDRLVAVGVVFAEHVTHDAGGLHALRIKFEPHAVHVDENAALHRLLAVRNLRKRTALHHRHRVFEIGLGRVAREREGAVFLGLSFGRGAHRDLFGLSRLQFLFREFRLCLSVRALVRIGGSRSLLVIRRRLRGVMSRRRIPGSFRFRFAAVAKERIVKKIFRLIGKGVLLRHSFSNL